MKKLISTITSGFVGFWIPVLILIILLGKMFNIIHHIVRPLEAHLPPLKFLGMTSVVIVAIIVMLILCYLGGLLLKLNWVQEKMQGVERSILNRIPGYSTFKVMLDKESEIQKDLSWNAVLVVEDDQHYLLGYTSYSSEHYYMIHKITTISMADTELMIVPKNKVIMLNITSQEFIQHVKHVKNTAELVEKAIGWIIPDGDTIPSTNIKPNKE